MAAALFVVDVEADFFFEVVEAAEAAAFLVVVDLLLAVAAVVVDLDFLAIDFLGPDDF